MEGEPVVPDESSSGADGTAPIRLFMSYRRADDRHFIGRLHDRLCDAFGDERVFRDIDSIPVGTNFRSVILNTLSEVDAVIAVIGPNWARPSAVGGEPDFVFLELAEALQQGRPVVPTLIEGTPMPAVDTLPSELRPLADIHAISVHGDPAFRRDSARLVEAIREVVADDRARTDRERRAAAEQASRAEQERSERERLAAQLRAEERAARARLAELEDAAARRQIELERARLEAIAVELRLAEAAYVTVTEPAHVTETASITETASVTEAADVTEADVTETEVAAPAPRESAEVAALTPPIEATQAEPIQPEVPPRTTNRMGAEQRWLLALILVALVAGIIGLFVNRSTDSPFNELSSDWRVDITVWVLTLAIGVPLLLWNHPVEQRFVLIGVTASSLFFEFLQASAVLKYGTTGFDEGTWFLVKTLQTACLVTACFLVRRRRAERIPSSSATRIALFAIAVACAVVTLGAIYDEWSQTEWLVESGYLAGRTPLVVWFVALALGPIVVIIRLGAGYKGGARWSLPTIATLAAVSYASQALVVGQVFDFDQTGWSVAAAAHALLAAVAWWMVVTNRAVAQGTNRRA